MTERKKGFIVHENFYEQLSLLSHEECGRLFLALFEYHKTNQKPSGFSPLMEAVFICFRQAMDQDRITYEATCQRNKTNGKKGGRPKKETSPQKPKKPDMDMEMGIDIDMDIDIDMGMDMDMEMENTPESSDSSAPRPSCSADGSAALSEQEKEYLIDLGLSRDYIEEREERLLAYAQSHARDPCELFLKWWEQDQRNKEKRKKNATEEAEHTPKSYDLDEFFEAAVRRGLREMTNTEASHIQTEGLT